MMSLVGLNCLMVASNGGHISLAVLRAASRPVQRSSDLNDVRVLVEHLTSGQREWLTLTNSERYSAVYIEDQLVWARRVLPSESNNPVAWPAKAYSLLCGAGISPTTILVEYFCDQERTYLQLADTKQLNLSEAKVTLSQHTQMLQELTDWEKKQQNREALLVGCNLTGRRVRVCSTQHHMPWITGTVTSHNLQTRELTVEDMHHMIHLVNPFLVQVLIFSLPQVQQMPSTNPSWYSPTGSSILAASPQNPPLQHPSFYGPLSHHSHGPSMHTIPLMQSDPNLHCHSPFDAPVNPGYTPTGSYTDLHMASSPMQTQGLNNLLETMYRPERSKSLGNIHLMAQNTKEAVGYRRHSAAPLTKRTRFADGAVLPPIPQESCNLDLPPNRALSRSASQPVLFPFKQRDIHNKQQHPPVIENDEDDLDLIQSIISRETSINDSPPDLQSQMMRSQSLSHIPRELGSLPSLHHASSLHVLHENYVSTPDVSVALDSPSQYRHTIDNKLGIALPNTGHHHLSSNYHSSKPHLFDSLGNETLLSGLSLPVAGNRLETHPHQPIHVASSPQLVPLSESDEGLKMDEDTEINIDRIVNQHMAEDENILNVPTSVQTSITTFSNESELRRGGIGEKTRVGNREVVITLGTHVKRGRGRPRLTEEEKQRRKELREMGLIKRSKRRTKEEVLQWKADKVRTPAKRGRKPGTGKKNMIKGVTGKIILVTVDLTRYENGSVFFQNGFCQAYPGVSRCIECASDSGDYPSSRYCRFLEFRKLRVLNRDEGTLYVEGFAMYNDAKAEDLVPWTPLKTGYSGIDNDTAIYVLSQIVKHFVSVLSEEARSIDTDILPVWKCAVKGVRELCDMCDTTVFNLHWVCRHCGFSICPACYQLACGSHDGSEAVSSWQTPWPICCYNQVPHTPYQLLLSQIIPGNVLSDLFHQLFQICRSNKIPLSTTPALSNLLTLLRKLPVTGGTQDNPNSTPHTIKTLGEPSSVDGPSLEPVLELPHSCSNGNDDFVLPPKVDAPHMWLCDGEILCLLDAYHPGNISAFQWSWHRNRPVIITNIDKHLNKSLWTPQSFSRDFGEEPADLVDCRSGLIMPQIPSKAFWGGFEDVQARLKDPVHKCFRLLKLKDWPTGEDFSDKLPQRFNDLMQALPLPDYTRRDGKLNLTASLPDFFVKPDLGPKMYNAYGTSSLPHCGTTNLHLDISDAVNVLVYTANTDTSSDIDKMLKVLEQETCQQTLQRAMSNDVGAIWHIYPSSDSDKIRQFLCKVSEERGVLSSKPGSDPIHDQLIYMDADLRNKLWEQEGIKGWTIPQCKGDAIFIPAGAPHQVQNQSSCIKVAEDFVSPEHVHQCIVLTEEFRQLSNYHCNHEDKLQIKNILYHSVKDVVGILKQS